MEDNEVVCPRCKGTGIRACWECGGDGSCPHCGEGSCPNCCGTGEADCPEYDGYRYVPKED